MSLEGHFDGKWPFDDISMKMHITEQHKIRKKLFRCIKYIFSAAIDNIKIIFRAANS